MELEQFAARQEASVLSLTIHVKFHSFTTNASYIADIYIGAAPLHDRDRPPAKTKTGGPKCKYTHCMAASEGCKESRADDIFLGLFFGQRPLLSDAA